MTEKHQVIIYNGTNTLTIKTCPPLISPLRLRFQWIECCMAGKQNTHRKRHLQIYLRRSYKNEYKMPTRTLNQSLPLRTT